MTVKRINKNASVNTNDLPGIYSPGPWDPDVARDPKLLKAYVEACELEEANANVNEINKEEKNMTEAKTNNIFGALAQEQKDAGQKVGVEKPKGFASINTQGMTMITVDQIEEVLRKKNFEEPDKDPEFYMAIKVTFKVDGKKQPTVFIRDRICVYDTDESKLEINNIIKYTIPEKSDPYVVRVKDESITKKPEEITTEDLEYIFINEDMRIWSSADKELVAIRKRLGFNELDFYTKGGILDMPEGFEMPIFVYEDFIEREKTVAVPSEVPGKKVESVTTKTVEPIYTASFVSPYDKITKNEEGFFEEKYGDYFTNSKSLAHKKICLQRPGVQRFHKWANSSNC